MLINNEIPSTFNHAVGFYNKLYPADYIAYLNEPLMNSV